MIERDESQPPFRGLCCECGNLRVLGRRWNQHAGWQVAHRGRMSEAGPRHDRGWAIDVDRCICTAKCDECGTLTTHAYLRNGEKRDSLEESLRTHRPQPWWP